MSVLIKGMEMPDTCFDCPCRDCEFHECSAKEHLSLLKDEYGAEIGEIPDWCPLVLVPPHGRLIDADALEDGWIWGTTDRLGTCECVERWQIQNAPTIIPAEDCPMECGAKDTNVPSKEEEE